jgi:hypothetical protein
MPSFVGSLLTATTPMPAPFLFHYTTSSASARFAISPILPGRRTSIDSATGSTKTGDAGEGPELEGTVDDPHHRVLWIEQHSDRRIHSWEYTTGNAIIHHPLLANPLMLTTNARVDEVHRFAISDSFLVDLQSAIVRKSQE